MLTIIVVNRFFVALEPIIMSLLTLLADSNLLTRSKVIQRLHSLIEIVGKAVGYDGKRLVDITGR